MMEAPHLYLFINENSLVEGAKEILRVLRPDWNLSATKFKIFTDGITNTLLGCFNADHLNDVILTRIYGNKTDLLIDRKSETKNIKLLHAAGFAPKLHATFDNGLVYEYVPGDVLNTETCQLEKYFIPVARKLADMHCIKPDCYAKQPNLWEHIRKFLSLVPEKFSDEKREKRFNELFPLKLDLEKEYVFLENQLRGTESPIVFCHNDLLLANVIYNSADDSVTFIDYEYAAYNYQAYDIANHFNEYAGVEDADYSLFPDEDYQKRWIRIYLEKYKGNSEGLEEAEVTAEEVDSVYSDVQKFTLASHYLWGVWCLLQVEYSLINFDFVNYASVRFREYFNRKRKIFSC